MIPVAEQRGELTLAQAQLLSVCLDPQAHHFVWIELDRILRCHGCTVPVFRMSDR
jgi:hypothetical protein